jgi:Tfp pilus assembly protein PilN
MIRINLYQGGTRTKRARRPGAPEARGAGGVIAGLTMPIVLVALLTAGFNVWYYRQLETASVRLHEQMRQADMDYARLSQVKLRYQERDKQRELYKRRVDVIDQLRDNQAGPAKLLSMLGAEVNRTDEVWLSTMADDGASIHLKGTALSIHAVANLMRNLQNTGFFKSVDIKASFQDEGVHDMQAFNFELICQKQSPAGPPAQPAPGPKKS